MKAFATVMFGAKRRGGDPGRSRRNREKSPGSRRATDDLLTSRRSMASRSARVNNAFLQHRRARLQAGARIAPSASQKGNSQNFSSHHKALSGVPAKAGNHCQRHLRRKGGSRFRRGLDVRFIAARPCPRGRKICVIWRDRYRDSAGDTAPIERPMGVDGARSSASVKTIWSSSWWG